MIQNLIFGMMSQSHILRFLFSCLSNSVVIWFGRFLGSEGMAVITTGVNLLLFARLSFF